MSKLHLVSHRPEIRTDHTDLDVHFITLETFNSWLEAYFERFHPQLPIIHLPTTNLKIADPYLLASIAIVGGCYIDGVRSSLGHLITFIECLNSKLKKHDGEMPFTYLYALVLLFIASLFCGNRKTYETAEVDRAALIAACRKESLFDGASLLRSDKTTIWSVGGDNGYTLSRESVSDLLSSSSITSFLRCSTYHHPTLCRTLWASFSRASRNFGLPIQHFAGRA